MDSLRNTLAAMLASLPDEPVPSELVWRCPAGQHDDVLPLRTQGKRWVRRYCACYWADRDRESALLARAEVLANQARHTFTWLGERWSSPSMLEKTFDTFIEARQSNAYDAAEHFAITPAGNLILHSEGFGLGKTHLLAAICNFRNADGGRCLFTSMSDFFARLEHAIAHSEDHHLLIDKARRTPLLVIDDVAQPKPSEFRHDVWFKIADYRANNRLPIALSTNRFAELDKIIGGDILSRLSIGLVEVELLGRDMRREL